jgi:hypothetical protein
MDANGDCGMTDPLVTRRSVNVDGGEERGTFDSTEFPASGDHYDEWRHVEQGRFTNV